MIHYILNSSQSYNASRPKVADILTRNMQEYMNSGAYKLPVPGKLVLEVKNPRCGYSGTIFWGEVALVAFSVAGTFEAAACVWPGLERMYLAITDLQQVLKEGIKYDERTIEPYCLACWSFGLVARLSRC